MSKKEINAFLDKLVYFKKLSSNKPQHKGFTNDILIAGNSTTLRTQDLFNGRTVDCENGRRMNGIFGKQGLIRSERDLETVDDLMPFLYIKNYTIRNNYPLPAYFLFFGETPNPVLLNQDPQNVKDKVLLDFNSGPWFNSSLVLQRCRKFINEAVSMSLDVSLDPAGIIVVDQNKKSHFIPVICVLYDLETLTLWRIESTKGNIFLQNFMYWLDENIDKEVYPGMRLFERRDVILKHINRLRDHGAYDIESLKLRNTFKKQIGCVDGRQDNNKSELGAVLGEKQFKQSVCDRKTKEISLCFHTECGYIITAIQLHRVFKAFRLGIDPSDTITSSRAIIFLRTLMKNPWVSRDDANCNELVSHINFKKVSNDESVINTIKQNITSLLTDNQGTLRYATSHMLDRLVFEAKDDFPCMTAAVNVENALEKLNIKLPEYHFNLIVTEELVRLDKLNKLKWLQDNASVIYQERCEEVIPNVEWKMEDMYTGRFFAVPEKFVDEQTTEEIMDLCRSDLVTGCTFSLERND